MRIAIYPGSFDPFHDGHLNIVKKASSLFDKLIIVVSKNINKSSLLSFEKRIEIITNLTKDFKNISVIANKDQLTTDIAKKLNAKYIVRGLRSQQDFDYELNYYDGFKSLDPNIEIVYFISDVEKRQLSSSAIKEIQFYKN
ncbi:Phosphopantetheine adenylyltransferase [Mycoplasma yeatsii 13926]|uniref:Phosphopantetheine adenylyltransferase n=1 Tax=Mycoplasma yeatsii 13926 TaxID=1188240 RepID=S6G437_9MOLU|nr:pantetheine-phosphate adenylyltransferase [Mycoplasma yeatsii]EOA07582.1 Phosphopantetheine adenylyltransferase [Mycoplasma yeatsii 13926]